jgi:hypothetical protein
MMEAKLEQTSGNFHRPASSQLSPYHAFHPLQTLAAREVFASPEARHSVRPPARGVSVSGGRFRVRSVSSSTSSVRGGGVGGDSAFL